MIASLSLDLDNHWTYLQASGRPGWEEYPSYFSTVVPRIETMMRELSLSISVFVVGRDLEVQANKDSVASLVKSGHELCNHSYSHRPWLHRMSREEIVEELERTEAPIVQLQGKAPAGFRGPGYSDSPVVREILAERGYRFCASPFPTCIGPLARAYYFAKTGISRTQREERERLFGRVQDAFASNKPKRQRIKANALWIVPVTVLPLARIPFHFSYLSFLAERSALAARSYFEFGLRLCQATRVPPSLLLHPLDFLSKEDVPDLSFFPGMNTPTSLKLERLAGYLRQFQRRFEVVSMSTQLDRFENQLAVR